MDSLESVVVHLGTLKAAVLEEAHLLFQDLRGMVKPCDAMALSVCHRAMVLHDGCVPLFEQKNLLAGAALLRMQIDSFLRFTAVYQSSDPHALAQLWLSGKELRDIKGDDGRKMTDRHLLELHGNPETVVMYEWACSHIHLSDTHFLHVLAASPVQANGTRHFHIGSEVNYVNDATILQLAQAQREAGAMVWHAVKGWRQRRPAFETADLNKIYEKVQAQIKPGAMNPTGQ